jgi:hypothetical protein
VRRKWTYSRRSLGGRPPIAEEVRDLILRMGRENLVRDACGSRASWPSWGITVSATAIRTLLRREGLGPAPRRGTPTWAEFLRNQATGVLAADFYGGDRVAAHAVRVLRDGGPHEAGPHGRCDEASPLRLDHPAGPNLSFDLTGRGPFGLLIRDRDSKYTRSFDAVFAADGMRIVLTPFRAPRANAFAKRWVRTVRRECLDWTLVFGRAHLEHVLREYVGHCNESRPHRGLGVRTPDAPDPPAPLPGHRSVRRRDLLGGLVHEYELAA